ncbi:hypothetical protein [Kordia sp.]|uniref:hypothetical protein n=1 Tax=Kordia sp. TaxID=1965332 RepID=UPI003D2A8552
MKEKIGDKAFTKAIKHEALLMAVNCVRNTVIEHYHAGTIPSSKAGDYSDVKVVTPYGDIPWNELSRINDKEMEIFNIEVINKLYTFLEYLLNPKYRDDKDRFLGLMSIMYPYHWNEPKLDTDFLDILISQKNRNNT